MLNAIDTKNLNDVKNRFLPLPRSAAEGLEHEPQITDFEIIKELGVGSFGQVYLAKHKKTKAVYAIKSIDKTDDQNLEEKANFSREVEIMYKLHHPNIVKLYGHFEDSKYCYFIMQYIPKRSVYEIIPKPGKKPNLQLIASVMKDLISAVYYLHNMKPIIIHRDIKPENVLLDENSRAYLTDFGWSNYIQSFKRRTTVCGTPLYLPPEMVNETSHDEKADIWCIGVLLFELSTGRVPFDGRDLETVKANILRLNITWPREIDPEVKDLISQILRLNPKSRLSIEEILSHSFFSKYFPNAVNELIKPDHQQNRIFIVSQDDPKTWGEIKKKPTISTSTSSGCGNTNSNINTNSTTTINNNPHSNTNSNNNNKTNNFTKINVRRNNTRTNSNSNLNANVNVNANAPKNFQRTKTFLVPKTEIDLTSHERRNSHNKRSSGRGNITTNANTNTKNFHSHNNSLNKSNRNSNAHKSFNTNTNNYRYTVRYNLRDNHSKNTTNTTSNNNNNSFRNSNNTYSSNTTNYTNSSNNRGSFINNLGGYSNNNYSSNTTNKGNAGTIKKTSTYSSNTFSKVNRMSYRNSNSKKYANNNNNATDKNRMSFKHNNHTNYNSNTINNNRSAYNPFLSNQFIQ
jgi:serine/threonine protein kinase